MDRSLYISKKVNPNWQYCTRSEFKKFVHKVVQITKLFNLKILRIRSVSNSMTSSGRFYFLFIIFRVLKVMSYYNSRRLFSLWSDNAKDMKDRRFSKEAPFSKCELNFAPISIILFVSMATSFACSITMNVEYWLIFASL